jgi:hypothetical protein
MKKTFAELKEESCGINRIQLLVRSHFRFLSSVAQEVTSHKLPTSLVGS